MDSSSQKPAAATGTMAILAMVAARGVAALLAIFVAWFVSPEVYGQFGRIQMVALSLLVLVCLRFERAILTARMPEALGISGFCVAMILLAAGPLSLNFFWLIPELDASASRWPLLGLLCAALAAKGFVLVATTWMLRAASLAFMAAALALQACVQFVVQILLVQMFGGTVSLLLIGEIAGAGALLLWTCWQGRRLVRMIRLPRHWIRQLAPWKRLPLYDLPASFLSQGLLALPILSIGYHTDGALTGHIALALRLTDAPMLLAATVATSHAVRAQLWQASARNACLRFDRFYVSLLLAISVLLLLGAYLLQQSPVDQRWSTTAGQAVFTLALSLAVATGGPYADLVTYAGRTRPAFAVHAVAFVAGVAVATIPLAPQQMLLLFATIILLRSAALRWLLAAER